MKQILLDASDGPEGITIFTDDERGVVDWAESFPALYCSVAIDGASVLMGPFTMPRVYQQLVERLGVETTPAEQPPEPEQVTL